MPSLRLASNLSTQPLAPLARVIAPHTNLDSPRNGFTGEAYRNGTPKCADMGWLGARNLWQLLNGERPESLVNPEAFNR